jgi:hypothetical protein
VKVAAKQVIVFRKMPNAAVSHFITATALDERAALLAINLGSTALASPSQGIAVTD